MSITVSGDRIEVAVFTQITKAEITAMLATHTGAADPHGDRAYADGADTAAISAHSGATDPHGDRADTTSQIGAHAAAVDPHADRAYADGADTAEISAHSGATDPHGDRAFSDTQLSRLMLDVTNFGAVGDGSADDTAALQAALDASIGGTLYLPDGIYKISSALTLSGTSGGYRIIGPGREYTNDDGVVGGAIIKNVSTSGANTLNISGQGSGQVLLQNIALTGNAQCGVGIYVHDSFEVILEDVWISEHGGHGIELDLAYGTTLNRVRCIHNGQNGLYVHNQCNLLAVSKSIFNSNAGKAGGYANVALSAGGVSDNLAVKFTSCDFEGAGLSPFPGVTMDSAFGMVVQGTRGFNLDTCYFEGAFSYLMYADGTLSGFKIATSYFQDGDVDVSGDNGEVTCNVIAKVITDTDFRIAPTTASSVRAFGNAATGGATITLVGTV